MIKKLEKLSADSKSGAELPIAVKDSAQQIWLAGLGAFAKAQEEGGKVFEALVKEGMSLQRQSQAQAEERLSEAADRMSALTSQFQTNATGQWDKLENIFEERVGKALKRLRVPSARDIELLAQRVAELTEEVRKLSSAKAPAATAGLPAVRKTAAPRRPAAPAVKKTAQRR